MLLHIVKNGESIDEILGYYHVTLKEIKNANLHITDFSNLVGGIKLRIPLVHDEIEQILESTECFLSDYYSKIEEEYLNDTVILEVKETKREENQNVQKERGIAYPGIMPPKRPYKGK